MCFRLPILLMSLFFSASIAYADQSVLTAAGLDSGDAEKTQSTVGSENPLAPTIAPTDTLHIPVGSKWEFFLRGRSSSGAPPILIGVALPSGAVMTDVGGGWSLVYWQPQLTDVGRHALTIRAMDKNDPNLLFERDIEIEVRAVGSNYESQSKGPAAANLDRSAVSAGGGSRRAPTLGPIATHIVSAGKVLTIKVAPEHDHELPPIVRIDRLPPNASFDVNKDGSRTLFWPTSNSDQGLHRFRFTVIHPDDASLKSTREMTVIVGDPSTQSTIPADN